MEWTREIYPDLQPPASYDADTAFVVEQVRRHGVRDVPG